MRTISDLGINIGNSTYGILHHAYCLNGKKSELFPELCNFLENEFYFKTVGNPDFWYGEFDTFGIDDGRMLKNMVSRRSFGVVPAKGKARQRRLGKKIFVLAFNFITNEAQNSLLKIFEEPTEETHFFIITTSSEIFLSTLKSRLTIVPRHVDIQYSCTDEEKKMVLQFLSCESTKRIVLLKKIIEDKDKARAISFLNNLESVLYEKTDFTKMDKNEPLTFEEVKKCRSYLYDRSPSVKMILEHISLVVPLM